MTDTITSADRKVDLKTWIARLDQRIEVVKHDITGLQDELDNLEIERATMNSTNSKTRRTALATAQTSTLAVCSAPGREGNSSALPHS